VGGHRESANCIRHEVAPNHSDRKLPVVHSFSTHSRLPPWRVSTHAQFVRHSAIRFGSTIEAQTDCTIRMVLSKKRWIFSRQVFVPHPFFGVFAVFDVDSCRIPAKDMALFISQWVVTDVKTTVLAIFAACPLLVFKRDAAQKGFLVY